LAGTYYSGSNLYRVDLATTWRHKRATVDLSGAAGLATGGYGAVVRSTNEMGFVAEQTVFALDRSTRSSTQGLAQ